MSGTILGTGEAVGVYHRLGASLNGAYVVAGEIDTHRIHKVISGGCRCYEESR